MVKITVKCHIITKKSEQVLLEKPMPIIHNTAVFPMSKMSTIHFM